MATYGSDITNIALILGLTALISRITVHSQLLRWELPRLSLISGLSVYQLWDEELSRNDALVLLVIFFWLIAWSIHQGIRKRADVLGMEMKNELVVHSIYPLVDLSVGSA